MFSDALRILDRNEEARYYSELETRIPVLEALVKEKEALVKEQEALVKEQEALVEEQKDLLEEKDKEIAQLKAMLEKQ